MTDEIDRELSDAFLADLHLTAKREDLVKLIADLSETTGAAAQDAIERFDRGEPLPLRYKQREDFLNRHE